MEKEDYPSEFYADRSESLKSAKEIVPMVMDLINPSSVIDFGCGNGSFLYVLKKNGVRDICGIDGPWIKKEQLLINENEFVVKNLEKFKPDVKQFDLAISLEVAEHLSENAAEKFIKNITSQSPIILFSAAIPLQGGVNHLNEQWQTYWIEIFKKNGYTPFDYFRKKLWDNKNVSFWFAQNMFLFINNDFLKKDLKLKGKLSDIGSLPESIIHPQLYLPRSLAYNQIKSLIPKKIIKLFKSILR